MKRQLEKLNLEKFKPLEKDEMKNIVGALAMQPTFITIEQSQSTYVTPDGDTWTNTTVKGDTDGETIPILV